MSEFDAIKLGYKMDDDWPICAVLSKNGYLIKAFLIENFGWRWPTLHHPEVLDFISKREKANE